MIDREGRDRLALALRRLASGRITNVEFDDLMIDFIAAGAQNGRCGCGYDTRGLPSHVCPECGRSTDLALSELAHFGWCLYDDFRTYRLRGPDALSPETRRMVARAVVFLKSDTEYIYGPVVWCATWPLSHRIMFYLHVGTIVLALGTCFGLWWTCLPAAGLIIFHFVHYLFIMAARLSRRVRGLARPEPEPAPTEFGGSLWPFPSEETYQAARLTPFFLAGRCTASAVL